MADTLHKQADRIVLDMSRITKATGTSVDQLRAPSSSSGSSTSSNSNREQKIDVKVYIDGAQIPGKANISNLT